MPDKSPAALRHFIDCFARSLGRACGAPPRAAKRAAASASRCEEALPAAAEDALARRRGRGSLEMQQRTRHNADAESRSNVTGNADMTAANTFSVGVAVTAIDQLRMREGEDLQSTEAAELEAGAECVVLEVGRGRRLRVKCLQTGLAGWVSCATKAGQPLLSLQPRQPERRDKPERRDNPREQASSAPRSAPSSARGGGDAHGGGGAHGSGGQSGGGRGSTGSRGVGAAAEKARRGSKLAIPPGAEVLPGGCLCCLWMNLKRFTG
mmetsp:Transcript_93367/g.302220  ORF Transcript_93367/g.302220 Transcript_93367/m.302220 type:complete len:266 (-) Transcript_93367:174-971(-)